MRKVLPFKLLCLLSVFFFTRTAAQVSVSATAGTTAGTYVTLANAFNAINSGTHQGVITITLTGGTVETASASLDSSGNPTGSSYTSVMIQPAAGTPVLVTGVVAGPLINLNGADNVTIDGIALAAGGATLTITNTSTAATACALRLINDASSNMIKNTTLRAAGAATTIGVVFFSTGLATGNDNNTLQSNDIDGTASAPIGIYSSGTTTAAFQQNSGNTVTNCWVHDFFNSTLSSAIGINLFAGNTDWNITGSSCYQTTPRAVTANTAFIGMALYPSYASDKHTVTGNFFGGTAPGASAAGGNMQVSGTGTFVVGLFGFDIETGGAGNLVDNNIVRNISMQNSATTASAYSNAGFLGLINGFNGTTTFSNNQVRDIVITDNAAGGFIPFQAFHMVGRVATAGVSVTPTFNVTNNIVDNIVANSSTTANFQIYGLRLDATNPNSFTSTTTINNPTFTASGNQVHAITVTSQATSTFIRGIGVVTTNGTSSTSPLWPKGNIINNTIYDLSCNSQLASYANPNAVGIQVTGSANASNTTDIHTISGNTIYNISAPVTTDIANAATGIIGTNGIYSIERNRIYSLSNTSIGTVNVPIVAGINLRQVFAASTIKNNFVSIGAGQNTNTNFFGILSNFSAGSPMNVYHNSVYITGTGGARNSVGFYRGNEAMTGAITTTVDIKNNIFYNFRSGGTGSNYAIGSFGTGTWTSDYNVLKSTNPATIAFWNNIAMDLPAYQAASGQDANSKNITVTFVDPAVADLHLSGASNGDPNLRGIPVGGITTDYDNQARSNTAPYIGADEASITLPVQLISFTGKKQGKANQLQWSTSSESNNKGFELERSIDGKNFSTITFMSTKAEGGTSTSALHYSFTDQKAVNGTMYYRLKQQDKDGKTTYSSSVVMIKGDKYVFDISSIYPNPATDRINLVVTSGIADKASVSIMDIYGRTIRQLNNNLIAGDNYINLDISSLAPGAYFIRLINSESEKKTIQFIKK